MTLLYSVYQDDHGNLWTIGIDKKIEVQARFSTSWEALSTLSGKPVRLRGNTKKEVIMKIKTLGDEPTSNT